MKLSEFRDKLTSIQSEFGDIEIVFGINENTYSINEDDVCQCDLDDDTKVALIDLDSVVDVEYPEQEGES